MLPIMNAFCFQRIFPNQPDGGSGTPDTLLQVGSGKGEPPGLNLTFFVAAANGIGKP